MSDLNDTPQIITLETLQTFKDELTNNFGLKLNTTNSLIQLNNNDLFFENNTAKVINSAVFGSEHEVSDDADYPQNVLLAGFGNVVSNDNQVVFGTFNKIPSKNAILTIGNGTGKAFRNNVLEIHTDGSIVFNNNGVYIDRALSSLYDTVDKSDTGTWRNVKNEYQVTILLDRSMLEVYVDGVISFTTRIYPKYGDSDYLNFFAENVNMTITYLEIISMNSAYTDEMTPPYYGNVGNLADLGGIE